MSYHRNKKIIDFVVEKYHKETKFNDDNQKIEAVAKVIFRDAIKGLEFLHSKNFVHRDIKPDNILISLIDGKSKLADFSVSCELEEDLRLMNSEGTAAFMAPEMNSGDPDGFLAKPTDIWSMGITLYAFLNNKTPFWSENEYEISSKAEMEEAAKLEDYSEEVNDLIQKMISKDPKDRPTATEVLEHKWFE